MLLRLFPILWAALPSPAWATKCDTASTQAYWGTTGPQGEGPTDTWIWDAWTWSTWTTLTTGYGIEPIPGEATLLGPDGVVPTDPVTLLLASFSTPIQVALAPLEALAPDTDYQASLRYTDLDFRTWSGPAEPPEVPTVQVHVEQDRWLKSDWSSLRVVYQVQADGAWLYGMDVDRFSERAEGQADLVATAAEGVRRRPSSAVAFTLSNEVCGRDWAGFDLADGQLVRFGAWNVAGEFSGWTEEIPLILLDPGRPRFRCASVPPAGAGWLLAAAAAARWRRRPRPMAHAGVSACAGAGGSPPCP